MRISFKKQPRETGLANAANPWPTTDIKVNKKIVGHIKPPTWMSDNKRWEINISIEGSEPNNPNCSWRWISPKYKPDNESEGREWVKKHLENFLTKNNLQLHYFDD